ncbi:MAG: hypothetical protein IKQ92_02590 [Clostridia bacterium]|nr:hypothetical protein [Clostridia bacterium]
MDKQPMNGMPPSEGNAGQSPRPDGTAPQQQGYPQSAPQQRYGQQVSPQQPQGYPGQEPQQQGIPQSAPRQPYGQPVYPQQPQGYPGQAQQQGTPQSVQQPYAQPVPPEAQTAAPQKAAAKKKSHGWIAALVIVGVLAVGGVGFFAATRLFGKAPAPIVYPVNPATPDDIEEVLMRLTELEAVVASGNGGYVYRDEEAEVTLTVVPSDTVEKEAVPKSAKDEAPSVVTGITGDTAYTAFTTPEKTVVYVTAGEKTVRAETKTGSAAEKTKTIKKAASVAASAVTAARVKEAYEKNRDDYDHNADAYFMEVADCLIFYPAQLTQKKAFEDQSVVFSDKRSSATCSVKLDYNPYRNIDELISLMKNSPNNTVLAVGDDWMTSETVQSGTVTFIYTGFGEKYMITASFSYPRKYSFVFDELRELIRCRFLENGKWKSGSRPPLKTKATEFGAPTYGMQDIFYGEHDLYLAIPDTLDEQQEDTSLIVFHDFTNGKSARVQFFETSETAADNLFGTFSVIAADGDVTLGDDYVRWHNKYGMYVGTVHGTDAALLEFEGEETYHAYEAVYDQIVCRIVPTYYEDQPTSPAKSSAAGKETTQPAEEPLEDQPTSGETGGETGGKTGGETGGKTGGKTEGKKKPVTPVVPENKIDDVIREETIRNIRDENIVTPETPVKNNPLVYHTDADRIAANSTVWDWDALSLSGRSSLLDTLLTVLAYNGYTHEVEYAPGKAIIQDDMNEMLDDMFFAHPELFTDELEGSVPQDIFPYFTDALGMDFIPEYRARSETALPEPDWLSVLREEDDFDPDELAWERIRDILDEGEDPAAYDPETLYVRGGSSSESGSSGAVTVGRSRINTDVSDLSWDEYGVRFSAEEVIELEKQLAEFFWDYYEEAISAGQIEDELHFWSTEEEGFTMHGPPNFDSIGEFDDEEDVGIYVGMYNDLVGIEPEIRDTELFAISEDGIWILYDSASGRVEDYGILIWDMDYSVLYTVTSNGDFMTLWFWDTHTLTTSEYGWLEYRY